jgi:hypothetical protein
MLAASFAFLTPWAAVLVVLAFVPLAAFAAGARRVGAARRTLGLAPPATSRRRRREALLVAVLVLLTLAAMQPVIRTRQAQRARTDAQALFVLDTSRSMSAAQSPRASTRLARAKNAAIALAAHLGDVPVGVATFTDRVLPALFPTADRAAFDSTVSSVTIEDPPPRDVNTVATTFGALTTLATQGFFPDSVHKRAVVLLTDGESRPFDPAAVATTLRTHGIQLAVVRVGDGADRVWGPAGRPEAGYRADPGLARLDVARLRAALDAAPASDAAAVVRRALGSAPERTVGAQSRTRSLAAAAAGCALLPLLLLLLSGLNPAPTLSRVVTFRRAIPATRKASA